MKSLSIALLGFFVTLAVTTPNTSRVSLSNDDELMIASVSYAISGPGLVSGDQLLEFPDDSKQHDDLNEKTEAELKDEEMRRLYLKLILMKGVGH